MNKEKMLELLKKKKAEGRELSPSERDAKMHVLGDIHSMAKEMMGDGLKGLKKVTVASPSKEGLEEGLETAKDIVGHAPAAPDTAPEVGGHVSDEDHESMEDEMEESPEHEAAESPEEEQSEHEGMSDEEIDAKIAELEKLKKARKGE